jgi:general secretion pathway protein D
LDAPTPQVLIGAKILEVSSDYRDKLGVRWAPTSTTGQPTFSGDDLENSLVVNNSASYTKTFVGNAMADSLANGVLNSKINLDVLIQFLRKNTDATVLAEPKINIADNEMGQLFVGARVPFLTGSMNTDVGGRNDTYNYKDVGVILEVTPRINNAEDVALKIRAESSTLRNGELINGGVVIDTRNFRTDLMLKNGQTAVLGGIINKQQQNIVRKVPILGSIPGLGWLFKKKDKTTQDMELMVFLSPRITRSPEQAKELMNEVEKSVPRVKQYSDDQQAIKEGKPPVKSKNK